eukprot:9714240-Karenia_brevis.AAC.1
MKVWKDIAEIAAEVIAESRSAYYAAERAQLLTAESKLQAENDQAVLGHKKHDPKNAGAESQEPKIIQRVFEMPKRPDL